MRADMAEVIVERPRKKGFAWNKPKGYRRQMRRRALDAGRSVVIHDTNPTPEELAESISPARTLGASVIGYSFESRLEDCLERNRRREGKARVPGRREGVNAAVRSRAGLFPVSETRWRSDGNREKSPHRSWASGNAEQPCSCSWLVARGSCPSGGVPLADSNVHLSG